MKQPGPRTLQRQRDDTSRNASGGQRREAQVQLESSPGGWQKDAGAPAAGPEKHTPPPRQGRGVDCSSSLHHHGEEAGGNGGGARGLKEMI